MDTLIKNIQYAHFVPNFQRSFQVCGKNINAAPILESFCNALTIAIYFDLLGQSATFHGFAIPYIKP